MKGKVRNDRNDFNEQIVALRQFGKTGAVQFKYNCRQAENEFFCSRKEYLCT